jgi:hypothetical protein
MQLSKNTLTIQDSESRKDPEFPDPYATFNLDLGP